MTEKKSKNKVSSSMIRSLQEAVKYAKGKPADVIVETIPIREIVLKPDKTYFRATSQDLRTIKSWTKSQGWDKLMQFCWEKWRFAVFGYFMNMGKGRWKIGTNGMSGNEKIVEALRKNTIFWSECWESSNRGGWHEFQLTQKRKKKP